MELINNTTKTLRDDLSVEIKEGSKLSIAAACFSIYAFQELKKQLSDIDELRFIFTSPTFITEKAKKEKREFYIPRLNRERSLYGTEFEIKLRNQLLVHSMQYIGNIVACGQFSDEIDTQKLISEMELSEELYPILGHVFMYEDKYKWYEDLDKMMRKFVDGGVES